MDVFVKIVYRKVCNGGNTALSERCICLIKGSFAYQRNAMFGRCYFKSKTHSGDAGANHKIVVFVSHDFTILHGAKLHKKRGQSA
jgi:hypothetical protein